MMDDNDGRWQITDHRSCRCLSNRRRGDYLMAGDDRGYVERYEILDTDM
jgi:hypothetical protein